MTKQWLSVVFFEVKEHFDLSSTSIPMGSRHSLISFICWKDLLNPFEYSARKSSRNEKIETEYRIRRIVRNPAAWFAVCLMIRLETPKSLKIYQRKKNVSYYFKRYVSGDQHCLSTLKDLISPRFIRNIFFCTDFLHCTIRFTMVLIQHVCSSTDRGFLSSHF